MLPFEDISWGLLTLVAWGCADFVARSASVRVGSVVTAFLVLAIGLLVPAGLFLFELAGGGVFEGADWQTAAWLAPLVGVVAGAAYAVYYTGFERGSVSIVSAVGSAWLAVSVLIAAAVLGESVGWGQVVLIAVVVVGVLTIGLRRGVPGERSAGIGWGLGAMVLLGVALALWKPLTDAVGPALSVIFVRLIASLVLFGYLRGGRGLVLSGLRPAWRVLLLAGLLDGLGFVFYNVGLDRASVVLIAPLAAAHPVATIGLAVLILRERPASQQVLGVLVTLIGVIALSAVTGE